MRVGAILLMAGGGERFGERKQFALLGNKHVYEYALETLQECADEVVCVVPAGYEHLGVPGGKTRQESSYIGLKTFKTAPDIVIIHDAARPFVSRDIILENIRLAKLYGAVDTCIPSADTLVYAPSGHEIASIPLRSDYQRGQTPQTFAYPLMLKAHEEALKNGIENASDDCRLVLAIGHKIAITAGSESNFKITSKFDLDLANLYLSRSLENVSR